MHWLLWALAVFGAILAVMRFVHVFVLKSGTLRPRKFANGMEVQAVAGDGGSYLVYKEMFEDKAYFQNGITLQPPPRGAVDATGVPLVIDVGANIGLFSLSVASTLPKFDIHCFEPIPMLGDATEANLRPYVKGGEQNVTLHRIGLGNAPSQISFNFDKSLTAASSSMKSPFDDAKDGNVIRWMRAITHDLEYILGYPWWITRPLFHLLGMPVAKYVAAVTLFPLFITPQIIHGATFPARVEQVTCDVKRLSDALKQCEGGASDRPIAMLKIDVEGAEWAVLQGIADSTWRRVHQVVVETHDVNGRVEQVVELLRKKGFTHIAKAEEWLLTHHLLGIETVFATRHPPTSS